MSNQITVITCQDDLVSALKRRRAELRMTCLQLDHKAGFHDGYTAHLENPHARSGRNSLRINPLAQLWLDALGLELVLKVKNGAECAPEQKTFAPISVQ